MVEVCTGKNENFSLCVSLVFNFMALIVDEVNNLRFLHTHFFINFAKIYHCHASPLLIYTKLFDPNIVENN